MIHETTSTCTDLLLSSWGGAQRAASAASGARAAAAYCPAAGAPAAGSAAAQSTERAVRWQLRRQTPPTAASGERCCTPPGSDGRADTARLITKENYFLFYSVGYFYLHIFLILYENSVFIRLVETYKKVTHLFVFLKLIFNVQTGMMVKISNKTV
jgi:hypothetical protein